MNLPETFRTGSHCVRPVRACDSLFSNPAVTTETVRTDGTTTCAVECALTCSGYDSSPISELGVLAASTLLARSVEI